MNVLILTDFSRNACNAGRYAVSFLKNHSAEFFILNINEFNSDPINQFNGQAESSLKKLRSFQRELEVYSDNLYHNFRILRSSDNLINTLRRELVFNDIDLIVIGRAIATTANTNQLLGDQLQEVIRKIKCNMIVVPDQAKYKDPETLILPVDFTVVTKDWVEKQLEDVKVIDAARIKIIDVNDDLDIWEEQRSGISTSKIPLRGFFEMIQGKYDLILVLGKNLGICDFFFSSDNEPGLPIENKLPTFVLHSKWS